MWVLIFLLLPVAAYSGWWIGKRQINSTSSPSHHIAQDYYRGLNFLINDKPDCAIDAFMRVLAINPESVETTLALGSLFRKRGEVDKAISLHQRLLNQPSLTEKQKRQTAFELGQDYLSAGVYDRAEQLFLKLSANHNEQLINSIELLILIYEKEKEWLQAIKIAKKLQSINGQNQSLKIAHYHCELAELAWSNNQLHQAKRFLKISLRYDQNCVRANLIKGHIERSQGKLNRALKAYQAIQHQNISLMPEAMRFILSCYQQLGNENQFILFYKHLMHDHPTREMLLTNIKLTKNLIENLYSNEALLDSINRYPSLNTLVQWVELKVFQSEPRLRHDWISLKMLLDRMTVKKANYQCKQCGLKAKILHWQCPSCRSWSTLKPIFAIEM